MKILPAESLRFPGEGKSAQGQPGAKSRPKGVDDAQRVNIPVPAVKVELTATPLQGRSPDQTWGCRKAEAILLPKPVAEWAEKSLSGTIRSPVLKLTQVGEESILRRSREPRLRN